MNNINLLFLPKIFQVGTEPDIVIFFDCPEDEMVKRLLGRNQVSNQV
jgi:thymidylate kinase